MGIQRLFTTQVYQSKLLSTQSTLHKDLVQECDIIRKKDRQGQQWSKDNYARGYTSYGSLDRLHEFSPNFYELSQAIKIHVRKYVKALRLNMNQTDLKLTRMWINHMGEACTHAYHIHPFSVISGTYYVKVPPGGSPLKFEDPRISHFMARPQVQLTAPREFQPFVTMPPKEGDLILFESWLKHEVPPNPGKRPRLSISFNFD